MESNEQSDQLTPSNPKKMPNWVYFVIPGILCIYYLSKIFQGSPARPLPVPGVQEYNQGLNYQETNQLTLAEQQYNLAIQENPDLAEAYLNLGVIYLNNAWYDGAEQTTNKCISTLQRTQKTLVKGSTVNQTLSIAYNNLGMVEIGRAIQAESKSNSFLARNHWKKGMAYYRKAVQLDPTDSQAQANIEKFKDAY